MIVFLAAFFLLPKTGPARVHIFFFFLAGYGQKIIKVQILLF